MINTGERSSIPTDDNKYKRYNAHRDYNWTVADDIPSFCVVQNSDIEEQCEIENI